MLSSFSTVLLDPVKSLRDILLLLVSQFTLHSGDYLATGHHIENMGQTHMTGVGVLFCVKVNHVNGSTVTLIWFQVGLVLFIHTFIALS